MVLQKVCKIEASPYCQDSGLEEDSQEESKEGQEAEESVEDEEEEWGLSPQGCR